MSILEATLLVFTIGLAALCYAQQMEISRLKRQLRSISKLIAFSSFMVFPFTRKFWKK